VTRTDGYFKSVGVGLAAAMLVFVAVLAIDGALALGSFQRGAVGVLLVPVWPAFVAAPLGFAAGFWWQRRRRRV
jgi:H+/Cl- antiporter ClcA